MSIPSAHSPPWPSGTRDPTTSAGLAVVSQAPPFQCSIAVDGGLDLYEIVRITQASRGPTAVMFEYETVAFDGSGSTGRPTLIHRTPFQCMTKVTPGPSAQMSSAAAALTPSATSGIAIFAQLRPS